MVVRAMVILGIMACVASAQEGAFPNVWKPADQPELKAQLANAPPLKAENMAAPARSVLPWGLWLIPNPDGKSYDLLKWYMKDYRHKTRVYIADLGTGKLKMQTFAECEDRVRPEEASPALAWDGKTYGPAPDWNKWDTGGAMEVYQFDPATDELKLWKTIPGFGGEREQILLGPDRKLYGCGTYLGDKNYNKVGAYSFDVTTGEVRTYAPLGPDHGNDTAYAYWMGVDDQYIYIASGKIPWYLLATDIKTGETKILKEAPPGDYPTRMRIWPMFPGARAMVQKGDDAPQEEFWLWHGEAIPKKDNNPPWPKMESPRDRAVPQPEVYQGQQDPDANGRAVIWWRSAEDAKNAPKNPPPGTKPEALGWKAIYLEGLETYPLPVHRMINLPDGRMFGTSPGYQGRFLYDPKTDQATLLGRGACSIYCLAALDGKVYFSGYSSAPIFLYDPNKPWTLEKGGPPGEAPPDMKSPECNPRNIGDVFAQTRVKKMMSALLGADGRIYFGGIGQRDYNGGGFGWYDPKTNSFGGMWKPFSGYGIHWLTPALDGRLIVISTRTSEDELNQGKVPPEAKVFVYDVVEQKLVRDIVPVVKADKAGPLVEVAPGLMLGTTQDPEVKDGGVLYGLNIQTGEVLFRKKLPAAMDIRWAQGTEQSDYQKGPDGMVYTYLGNVMVRIDPKTASVETLGKFGEGARTGKITFSGNDIYLCGEDNIRKLAGVVKQ